MIADDDIAMFSSMTSASPEEARRYLEMSGSNLEQAVSLFFDMGGSSSGGASGSPPMHPAPSPHFSGGGDGGMDEDVVAEVRAAAIAAGLDASSLDAPMGAAEEEVRAPIASFQDQMIDPGVERRRMQEAMKADASAMHRRMTFDRDGDGAGAGAGGEPMSDGPPIASGGSAINNLFSPPEYNEQTAYYQVKEKALQESKFILVNIQQAEVFASHTLNRDVWSDDTIKEIIQGSFLFWQRDDKSAEGDSFCKLHSCGHQLPHICVIDPRTGRRMKSWDGRKWVESHAAAEYLFSFLEEFSMSRSPPAMSPSGSPTMGAQAPPAIAQAMAGLGGDMRLVGYDEKADSEMLPPVAPAEPEPAAPAKEAPCAMPEEPPAGGDAVKVVFKLPGSRAERRFLPTDTVETMFRVASALTQEPVSCIDMSTQFPKRALREVGMEATVKDAQVAGGVVMVSVRA
mmetsp:Transcript_62626/g.179635  ORF Transcript_62626/g.179635 Transcript_62626/m.179635 type:complete len:456 (-) Transcript_62626:137-1504(-)